MNEPDHAALMAATFGAEFAHERRCRIALYGRPLNASELTAVAHEALTAARGAVQGLKGLAEMVPR